MGARPISGVATSVTAFVGATRLGPVNRATTLTAWPEYEKLFGGVDADSPVSYSVKDFFENGGRTAIVVRIGVDDQDDRARSSDPLPLQASSPGSWANDGRLSYQVKPVDKLPHALRDRLDTLGLVDEETPGNKVYPAFFSLEITHAPGRGRASQKERFEFLCAHPDSGPFRFDRVVNGDSLLVHVAADVDLQAVAQRLPSLNASTGSFADGRDGSIDESSFFADRNGRRGLYALDDVDIFNLLIIPPFAVATEPNTQAAWNTTYGQIYTKALAYCRERSAMLLVDPPRFWAKSLDRGTLDADIETFYDGLGGVAAANAATYFPWFRRPNAERYGELDDFPPCGAVAGVMSRTDAARGVWKAPAGDSASLVGAGQLQVEATDGQNGRINLQGINCLRSFAMKGTVVWGARTLRGAELLNDEWKYVPVRRLALYLHESLMRGSRWAVFEPNDETLWSSLRTSISGFMQDLQRQGAFYDFFVKCDNSTTTPADIAAGVVHVIVGFAPVKPAEFVVLHFQQQTASS